MCRHQQQQQQQQQSAGTGRLIDADTRTGAATCCALWLVCFTAAGFLFFRVLLLTWVTHTRGPIRTLQQAPVGITDNISAFGFPDQKNMPNFHQVSPHFIATTFNTPLSTAMEPREVERWHPLDRFSKIDCFTTK
ncbi:unnamed protein product, partial [Ectocarpus sp. 8 AP-2014]